MRQAWELDDADKAEKLLRNLAQRLERDWSGVAGSILEGIDEILTVTRLGLPKELRRSLACTNIIENVMSAVRRVCRNVKRWRSASMAMRWTAAANHLRAPRIHGELLKLGFEIAQSTVSKHMVNRNGPPSQRWLTFLRNHAPNIASMYLFVVPTIGFVLLYVLVIIRLERRDLVWINVTRNPTNL